MNTQMKQRAAAALDGFGDIIMLVSMIQFVATAVFCALNGGR